MGTNGVIYQLSGLEALGPLQESIKSLRKVYDGPVCVAATPDCWKKVQPLGCELVQLPSLDELPSPASGRKRARHYMMKTITNTRTPFDRTVYLDADVEVLKPIDELFQVDLAFVNVQLDGRKVRVRMQDPLMDKRRTRLGDCLRYELLGGMAAKALRENVPFYMTGLYAFRKDHPAIWHWASVSLLLARRFTGDSFTLQLVAPLYDIVEMPSYWCVFPKYEKPDDRAVTIHHARKFRC